MPRPKKHESTAAKIAASEQKWRNAGNCKAQVWIPADAESRQKLKEFAAQLRRDAGTFLPEDLIL